MRGGVPLSHRLARPSRMVVLACVASVTLLLNACAPTPQAPTAPTAAPTSAPEPAATTAPAAPAAAPPSPQPAAASPSAAASPAASTASPAASSAKPAPAPGPHTAVTIPQAAASVASLPFFVGVEQGFFAARGLDVTLQAMPGNVAQAALTKGEVQFLSSPSDAIAGYANGLPFKVVYECWDAAPWALVGKNEIANLQGMRGKTVAASRPGSAPYAYLEAGLKQAGLGLNDVNPILTTGTEGSYAALLAGQVDAAVVSPPFDIQAERSGFHTIAPLGQYLKTPYIGLATSTQYLAEHRPVVVNVIRALQDSVEWIRANPSGSQELIATYIKVPPDVALRAYERMVPLLTKTGETNVEGVTQLLGQLEGVLNKPITADPNGAVDEGPRREALAR